MSISSKDFPHGTVVKNPLAMQGGCRRRSFDPWVGEDPLEKEMSTHSRILAWKTPWTEEPGRLQAKGLQRVGHTATSDWKG